MRLFSSMSKQHKLRRSKSILKPASSDTSLSSKSTIRLIDGEQSDRNALAPQRKHEKSKLDLYNCCIAVIYCRKHDNLVLQEMDNNTGQLWLPFIRVKCCESWLSPLMQLLRETLKTGDGHNSYLSFSQPETIHIVRLQCTDTLRFFTLHTFFVELTDEDGHPTNCCQSKRKVKWIARADITSHNISNLWGPEPLICVQKFGSEAVQMYEHCLQSVLKHRPRSGSSRPIDNLLKLVNYTENDIVHIYAHFIDHMYPSCYMTLNSFASYVKRLGWDKIDINVQRWFYAFDRCCQGYLTFHDLLIGFAAMETATTDLGDECTKLRLEYVFRYYDLNRGKRLRYIDLELFAADMFKSFDPTQDRESAIKMLATICHVGKIDKEGSLDLTQFLELTKLEHFKSMKNVFRIPGSLVAQIEMTKLCEDLFNTRFRGSANGSAKCATCKEKKFMLARHAVRVDKEGHISDFAELVDVGGESAEGLRPIAQKSVEVFSTTHVGWRLINTMKIFRDSKKRFTKRNFKKFWDNIGKESKANEIVELFARAEEVFKSEPRCVQVDAPCYVFGDIHGNLNDLYAYERILWPKGPLCTAANYLFLGDYVDRGYFGLECIIYLFSCKVLNPTKYWMVRGNHEDRRIQKNYTFLNECKEKFGTKLARTIWEACNNAFDNLPLCAVIDGSIFCAHGGIPRAASTVAELNKIPIPLPDPEHQSEPAWEMLWNDPISNEELFLCREIVDDANGGFVPNRKRGTAFCYSEKAVENFLNKNSLSHVFRGHEVFDPGFKLHHNGKVITVFSSSNYDFHKNSAATIYVANEKLTVMILETRRLL